ncbi:MAG: imelysin family protein [Pseudomonadota bacterium]
MRAALLSLTLCLPLPGWADAQLQGIVDGYVLPGFRSLATTTETLARTAQDHCAPNDPELRAAFGEAWDAWIHVSHLRFGPTETDNRAFGLGFWPDSRGAIPKSLARLIAAEDAAVEDPEAYAEVSVAARGFTALEFLIYDANLAQPSPYHCALVQAVASDIARTSKTITDDWTGGFGASFANPGPGAPYGSVQQAKTALYTALLTGNEFTRDARLGRPMGTFERPRPTRAEARRSERAQRHVALSIDSTSKLAVMLADGLDGAAEIEVAYNAAAEAIASFEDPSFAGVSDPSGRFRLEATQQRVATADQTARVVIGPGLGLAEGFNSLDGD